jgi:hypothetical protein
MSFFSGLEQWLGEQIVPVFFVAFALLAGAALVYLSAQSRRATLKRQRAGRTEESFAEYLGGYGFDMEIARTTYRYLQDRRGIGFPIEPTDDLDRDLGLDGEDLQETLRDLLQATGRQHLPGMQNTPLVTVVDLVRYIQASPRKVIPMRRRTA